MAASKIRIEVGFVSIAARMEKATNEEDADFRTVCLGDGGKAHEPTRVKNHVDCPSCGRSHSSTFAYADRAVETADGLAVVTKEQIAEAAGTPIKAMSLKFHDREKYFAATLAADSVQNITPDKGGEKAYAALVAVLRARPSLVASTVYAPRTKNAMWVLEVQDERLVASKRCWPEDVRPAPAVTPAEVTDVEVDLLGQFVDMSVTDFDLAEYSDERRTGVQALVDSTKVTGLTAVGGAATTTDLLAALTANLAAATKPKAKPRKRAAKKAVAA